MSRSAVMRFVWKEYRILRAFWLAMVLITLLGQLMLLVTSQVSQVPSWLMFSFAMALAAFYALACGATMFATEREDATYEFLHSRPVANHHALAGKLVWALISTVAFAATVWGVAWLLAHRQVPEVDIHRGLWQVWGVAAIELLAWGMFFSLLLQSPLKAAILASAAASAVVQLMLLMAGRQRESFVLASYEDTVGGRLLVAALLLIVNIGLALRWLRPTDTARQGWIRRLMTRESDTSSQVSKWLEPFARIGLDRLLWHAWQQATGQIGPLVLAMGATAVITVWVGGLHDQSLVQTTAAVTVIFAALVGSISFLGDHRQHRYLFFATHGVSPRYVWFSRQVVGIGLTGIATIVSLVVLAFVFADEIARTVSRDRVAWDLIGLALCFGAVVLAAYASGQFGSMVCRSGILAGFIGLSLTAVASAWAVLMMAIGMNPIWSVLPISFVFLFSTWLRANDWIRQRNTVKDWIKVGLSVLVPMSALVCAVAVVRVVEIPLTSPGFSTEEFSRPATPAELETARIYERAYQLLQPIDSGGVSHGYFYKGHALNGPLDQAQTDWIADNQESLTLLRQASIRPECLLTRPGSESPRGGLGGNRFRGLGVLLQLSGRQSEIEGKLDQALDDYLAILRMVNHLRYRVTSLYQNEADRMEREALERLIRWSGRQEQSSSMILRGLHELEEIDKRRPARTDVAKTRYVIWRRVCDMDMDGLSLVQLNEKQVRRLVLISRLAPWEQERARRLLNVLTRRSLEVLREAETVMRTGGPPDGSLRRILTDSRYSLDVDRQTRQWLTTTPALLDSGLDHGLWWWIRGGFQMETRRRAARLVLAIQAWRVDHDELPKSLDVLVQDGVVDWVPVDPCSGEQFRYFPEGLTYQRNWPNSKEEIAEYTPVVWSTGLNVWLSATYAYDEESEERWSIDAGNSSAAISVSEAIWQGWAFPIP